MHWIGIASPIAEKKKKERENAYLFHLPLSLPHHSSFLDKRMCDVCTFVLLKEERTSEANLLWFRLSCVSAVFIWTLLTWLLIHLVSIFCCGPQTLSALLLSSSFRILFFFGHNSRNISKTMCNKLNTHYFVLYSNLIRLLFI